MAVAGTLERLRGPQGLTFPGCRFYLLPLEGQYFRGWPAGLPTMR
jgi:hypothetical protein